ncbi:MAG: XRE family transcriptional regulator [Rickettsia aeschlimannii]
MSEDIRSKERFNRINDISETNKDGPEEIRNNFKKFVLNILETDNITPYKLSEKTGTHETAWKNFLDGRTKMPDMGAIVALADYKNVPLDEVIGRDINKAKKITVEIKQTPEISASIAKLPKDILQEAMLIGEKTRGFIHKPTNKETKSFAKQVKSSNKPKKRSI